MLLKRVVCCATLLIAAPLLVGCAEKLTFQRWQTLTLQSPKAEVETVLGKPNQLCKDEHWMYHNPDKQITVNVEFVGGDTLTYSRWIDPDHGIHEIGKSAIEGTNLIQRETSKTDINR